MKPFIKESGFEKLILILCCFGSLLLFGVFYEQHLYQKEQLQLFELSSGYFLQRISQHGGFADYIGEFLVQFFHLPFAGAVIITALFLLLCFQTRWIIYRISGKKPAILFTILPAAGYLILLLDDFYSLSGLAGLILALATAMFYISLKSVKLRSTVGIILIPLIYWLTGGAYLVFVSLMIIHEIMSRLRNPGNQNITVLVMLSWLVLAIGFPLLGREYIFNSTLLQAFMSGSYYRISIFFPIPLIILFILFPLLSLHQHFVPEIIRNKMPVVYKLLMFRT